MDASGYESLSGKVDLPFPEYDQPPSEPLQLVRSWLSEAREIGVREPSALALATADSRGRASNRIVAITDVTDLGVVFTSHSCSQKGRELAATGWASGLLYWRETGQQIILSGPVELLPDAESDALWSARPIPLHAMSTVTQQSEPLEDLEDVEVLRARARSLELTGEPQPRPEFFVGYRLQPDVVEFWSASSDRLHRRLRYDRDSLEWRTSRLQP
ncbi:phenazine biosynthesis FMN-dependent oxidase PhzG [Streptomyces sp. NPDC059680]|uniref:phenazine biosynthesis FMN-dependent oxidase PhzG n=1 Tax=Streptomyces TaxID=1883 RepID=UPI001E3B3C79|nr:phenazine biosynthesis FMN-dependent oxidase PhzG [Streptomyces barringtoniae]MCC5474469.1 phenazine biosynthesis FMN-dependent oxidase PhzG [Streptomyces barringtoniae]